MYSLILLLPLYFLEMSLAKRLLVSAFLFLVKYCSIFSRNFFAFSLSDLEPWNASRIECFMIIMHIQLEWSHFSIFGSSEVSEVEVDCSILSAKSKSTQPRTISMPSFHTFKFVSFSFGKQYTWAAKFEALAILTK